MNKVTLYIAGQEVELNDDALILYNYKLEDMSNPTIVENSYSQSISILGTPANNKIFGDIWRLDRDTLGGADYIGPNFDATRKTPFVLCDSTGAQIESGYVKLDNISIDKNNIVTYKVTLYGGLGSYLYGLQYKEDGNKMTLADLQYLETGDSLSELTFQINKTNVADAWNHITPQTPGVFDNKWNVVNFAPAYNGIPTNNFNADKALIKPAEHGLSADVVDDGVHYTPRGQYALVTMSAEHTEWHCKDLRSYLQRPILSIRAFLNALTKSVNSNGFSVDIDSIKDLDYANTWMTLPMLPDLGTFKQTSGSVTATITSPGAYTSPIARIDLVGASSLASGTTINATFNLKLFMTIAGRTAQDTPLVFRQTKVMDTPPIQNNISHCSVGFAQLVAYDSDGNIVGGSNIHVIGDLGLASNATQCAYNRGFTPVYQDDTTVFEIPTDGVMKQKSLVGSLGTYELCDTNTSNAKPLVFNVSAQDVEHYKLHCTFYNWILQGGTESINPVIYLKPVVFPDETVYASQSGEITDIEIRSYGAQRNASDLIAYTSTDYLRSNAVVTKAMLLTTDATPADYLLSLCKTFGWYFVYDQLTKTVAIKTRNDLFNDNNIIDLTDRIDRAKGLSIAPYAIDSKWYEFAFESDGGQFADTYEESTGRVYGMKRINTGYEFNSEKKDILDSVIFKGAVPSLETNKYNNIIMNGSQLIPSVFLDTDNKYTMWSTSGTSKDIDISQPASSLTPTWLNTLHGYDIDGAWKMQLHGDDNSANDGSGVLVFYNGTTTYQKFKLSDDLPEMNQVNDGVPCWILGYDSQNPTLGVPIFSAYKTSGIDINVALSLDFGMPMELNIPNIAYTEDKTIYHNAWKNYLADKYHKDTKVLTAYIDFRGLKVEQSLLRKFYFYDGALWIINKISNYSMTTYDPCKCELVKVQDMDNYTDGQEYL